MVNALAGLRSMMDSNVYQAPMPSTASMQKQGLNPLDVARDAQAYTPQARSGGVSPPQRVEAPPQPRGRNALSGVAQSFMPQQRKPNALDAFVDTFQRTIDPQAAQARDQRMSADGQTKLEQGLAFVQQMRAMPLEQRMQFAQSGVGNFGLGEVAFNPEGLSDSALDQGIAALSAHLGRGPAQPERMTPYQEAQLELERQKMGQPSGVNLGDGAYAEYRPGQGLNMLREPTPEAPDPTKYSFENFDGATWAVDPTDPTKKIRLGAAPQGTQAAQDTYRPATAEDRARWGVPEGTPLKINNRTNEPQVISGAKPASEYSATEVRGFRDKADGLYTLKNAVEQYVATLEKMGGPQLLDTPLNAENVQALKSAHGLITEAIKDAGNLGALDQGVQNLVNAIISNPVGLDTIGKSTDSIKQAAKQLYGSIDFKLSRIPEDYRYGSTGIAPGAPQQTPTPAPQASRYTPQEVQEARMALQNFNALPPGLKTPEMRARLEEMANGGAQPTPSDAPPPAGVDPDDWKYMTPEQKALFQ